MKKSLFIVFISFSLVISACSAENSTKKESKSIGKSTIENVASDQTQTVNQDLSNLNLYTQMDNAMTRFEEYHNFSGAVYVGVEGEEIYSNAFGKADFDKDIPNTLDTKFIMASLTKQFTAAAVLLLEERGLLEIDHQVTDYLPGATQWEEITIHHLLSMSSGIVNTNHPKFGEKFFKFIDNGGSSRSNFTSLPTTEEAIAIYNDIPLNFKPGERYEYSNSNYIVLGLIIEQISGETYETFLEKNIFGPLEMLNSGSSIDWDIQENKALGYEKILSENDVYPTPYYEYFLYSSAGGLYTTMNDLVTWDRALYSEKLLKKETIDKMYAPYTKIPANSSYGSGFEYGYGWLSKGNIVEHAGYSPGYLGKFIVSLILNLS
ncbi:serine hydrolase domain-containing protein [Cytobacillus sp. IB215665]|uniref:serine hydrolase domain-containing protein n=1 Tax=Cytobacillus sp. IB215665 TaxID=3097357 RepID=UPI002A183473|nr:serine hydrolase domain-containing protein [Cytobacillus sp. IB215665]MDX8366580.1 serine hydrolase domain-containing protein [Cytobacillus sp. IB215665]